MAVTRRPTKSRKPNRPPASRSAAGDAAVDGRHARRFKTEARLQAALGAILHERGPAALGVNAVAERAGVEKVLIYRYYGSLEGVMQAYAEHSDFWPSLPEILGEDHALARAPDHALAAARMLGNYAAALRKRPVTLDLLAWECTQRNPLTIALEAVREERAQELFAVLVAAGFPMTTDAARLSALLSAAINYLAVRSREIALFAGLDVRGDPAWQSLERLYETLFRALFAAAPPARS
jgi:AcrR family transcriptional regulator